MSQTTEYIEYAYRNAGEGYAHHYLLDTVRRELSDVQATSVFEIGAGNGYVAGQIAATGRRVAAIEMSKSGVRLCRANFPAVEIEEGSAYDDLAARFGQFSAVVSLEVVEHLYSPRLFARALNDLLLPGGTAIISTPYHGYWKNLALALSGKLDQHFTALWDGGHIKFWSVRTLSALLEEQGLSVQRVHRVGRIAVLAKSMIVVARKPA